MTKEQYIKTISIDYFNQGKSKNQNQNQNQNHIEILKKVDEHYYIVYSSLEEQVISIWIRNRTTQVGLMLKTRGTTKLYISWEEDSGNKINNN